ncbi:type II toxin-antitoxin system RelB/DinJ family antitoxin [Burkholderia pseudomallei]|uniref:type II toxin-antitoxin system RelB/DinJ family antitoxin n=1 Tax=Burkholderia pseudomallei TaxID=28450 RepID=UPI001604AF7A|nr:type II toxin-antitoxin system RelB/DinJ family antitoxin [Burkholderia pseudomallei]
MTLKIVSLKVDSTVKTQADTVLSTLGVSFSEFTRMALIHLVERGELPFDRIDSGVRVGRRHTRHRLNGASSMGAEEIGVGFATVPSSDRSRLILGALPPDS